MGGQLFTSIPPWQGPSFYRLPHWAAEFFTIDLLILADIGIDAIDATRAATSTNCSSRAAKRGSIIVASNRGPDEWLATFADPIRARAAVDRSTIHQQRLRPRHRR